MSKIQREIGLSEVIETYACHCGKNIIASSSEINKAIDDHKKKCKK